MENTISENAQKRADLKRIVLSNGLDKTLRHLSLGSYMAVKNDDKEAFSMYQGAILDFKTTLGDDLFKATNSVNQSRYNRLKTVKKKIKKIVLSGKALFITLTFTDEVLKTTSENTRRTYVARFCKEYGLSYVANEDFGEEKGREHYHSVMYPKNEDIEVLKWDYGFILAKPIRRSSNDLGAVSRYVTKLSYHSVKDTASMKRIIYSRKNNEFYDKVIQEVRQRDIEDFKKDMDLMLIEEKEANKTKEELVKELF